MVDLNEKEAAIVERIAMILEGSNLSEQSKDRVIELVGQIGGSITFRHELAQEVRGMLALSEKLVEVETCDHRYKRRYLIGERYCVWCGDTP